MAEYTEEVQEIVSVDHEGGINIRRVTVVFRDGVKFSESPPHREVVTPGEDLAPHSDRVRAIAGATWTPVLETLWNDRRAQAKAEMDALVARGKEALLQAVQEATSPLASSGETA